MIDVKNDGRWLGFINQCILQYKTQYKGYIGLPVTNVPLEIFVQLLSILSLHKHLY